MTDKTQTAIPEGWRQAWDEYSNEVDERILQFTRIRGSLCSGGMRRLSDQIRLWFDQEFPHLGYDPGWQRAKCDPHALGMLLQERISHLLEEGRLSLSVVEAPVVEE